MSVSRPIPPRAWALLILLGGLWGGSFFFARIAVMHVPPMTLAFLRLSIAALALHVFIAGRDGFYETLRSEWRSLALMGLINNAVPHTLLFYGQQHLGAGLASVLNATTPIWTILIAHALTSDERLNARKVAGVAFGVAGAAVLIVPGIALPGPIPVWALLLPVAASMSYGFAAIFGRRFRTIKATHVAAGQLTASSLMLLPACLLVDHPWTLAMPPAGAVAAILALALGATAFAYILFFRIIALAGATNVSLVTLLVPVSAVLLGALFLGERLTATEGIGMALIGGGLLIIDGRLVARFRMVKNR